jgi:hypothetical protein
VKRGCLLICGSFAAVLAAAVTYISGVWYGHFFAPLAWDEVCVAKPLNDIPSRTSWLPLSNSCVWKDGTSTELVPGFVNPLTLAFLVAAAACLVLAVLASRRHRAKDLPTEGSAVHE